MFHVHGVAEQSVLCDTSAATDMMFFNNVNKVSKIHMSFGRWPYPMNMLLSQSVYLCFEVNEWGC